MSGAARMRILVVGIGGQGVIFASKVLAEALLKASLNVVMSEVHGMAQRGGVVTCQICVGDVQSPLIADGEANIILAFEPVEAYRLIHKANTDTAIIANTEPVKPLSANLGETEYPEADEVIQAIKDVTENLMTIHGSEIAANLGSRLALNSVLLGALAGTGKLPIASQILKDHLLTKVPRNSVELNEKAFDEGLRAVR
jgi:indolepyruvate ferredoxin oxidoreductase beta subunit